MTKDMAFQMSQAGCVGVWYGLESGSQEMLDRMNKKATIDQYRKVIEINRKYFEYEDYTFIVGTPGETDETVNESIQFCKEMEITPSAVFFMTPYPGTPLWHELVMTGRVVPEDLNWLEDYVLGLDEQGKIMAMNLTDYEDQKVIDWHDKFIDETGAMNK